MLCSTKKKIIDYKIFLSALSLSIFGLIVIYNFSGSNYFFIKQLISLIISVVVFFVLSHLDFYFLKNRKFIKIIYIISISLLTVLFILGSAFSGAQSWFSVGIFAFQPTDFSKLSLILILSLYFSKRHSEMANFKHIIISGIYAIVIFILLLVQPDFGSAFIIFLIWFGIVIVSGINKKHVFILFFSSIAVLVFMWNFVFATYQKDRISNFINPSGDIYGTGYNANQSIIATGSGGFLGRGIGYGVQSRLDFLPESKTDFIFSSIAEEWGFVGVLFIFTFFGIIFFRLIKLSSLGRTNFDSYVIVGIAIYFMSHFLIHVGIDIGLFPVTGTTLPFISYGGSHLLIEFSALAIVNGISRNNRMVSRNNLHVENTFIYNE